MGQAPRQPMSIAPLAMSEVGAAQCVIRRRHVWPMLLPNQAGRHLRAQIKSGYGKVQKHEVVANLY